jgi:putative membrane protein
MLSSITYISIFGILLIWILLIGLAYLLIKYRINRNKISDCEGKTALDIVKERYARSEITKEEFEEIKKNLI